LLCAGGFGGPADGLVVAGGVEGQFAQQFGADAVNDGYSAGRDRPPIVLGRAGSWSSLNASKPVMRQAAG
jgi:hypothetical protein